MHGEDRWDAVLSHDPLAMRDTVSMSAAPTWSFLRSAETVAGLPASPREVAVIGRSNVGKSTLVNALAGRSGLAYTSKSPGRTQLLNCFATPDGATLVDLPGYGYAKVPAKLRAQWRARMEQYLLERENLRMVLALVDAEVGPTTSDVEWLTWLRVHEVPFTVVATKWDKVKSSARTRRKRDLATGCGVAVGDMFRVAAAKGQGIPVLRETVAAWLAGTTGSGRPSSGSGHAPDPRA